MMLRSKLLAITGATAVVLILLLCLLSRATIMPSFVVMAAAAVTLLTTDRLVVSRLSRLFGQVTHIAERRDHSLRVRAGGKDEIGQLGQAINGMLDALERAEKDLAAHRDDLERVVDARTAELVQAERQAAQSEKLASVGQLAAGIAHEINTPIQFVGDNLKSLEEAVSEVTSMVARYRELSGQVRAGTATPETVETIAEAEQAADLDLLLDDMPKAISQSLEGVTRVAGIVRAMREFSHADRGGLGPVEINRAIANTLTVARNEYKYVADVETDLGPVPDVEGYGSELNQVFLNLVVNAAHAIADTGQRGRITISTREVGGHVEIRIADTGTGIPEKVRGRIFDPFFTTKDVGRGTGQGLTISHQIVTGRHHGTLTFETETGVGTTFVIRLPVRQPADADADIDHSPAAEAAYI